VSGPAKGTTPEVRSSGGNALSADTPKRWIENESAVGAHAAALNNLALVAHANGEEERALALTQQALALVMRQGDRHRQAALQDGVLVLDLAAPSAGEVALVEGLELEDEREFLVAPQPLSGHIRSNPHRLSQWHRHGLLLCPALAYIWATSTRSVARSASAGPPPASARVGKT